MLSYISLYDIYSFRNIIYFGRKNNERVRFTASIREFTLPIIIKCLSIWAPQKDYK